MCLSPYGKNPIFPQYCYAVAHFLYYADCRYIECCYADCRGASSGFTYGVPLKATLRHSAWHLSNRDTQHNGTQCCYAECRGTLKGHVCNQRRTTSPQIFFNFRRCRLNLTQGPIPTSTSPTIGSPLATKTVANVWWAGASTTRC